MNAKKMSPHVSLPVIAAAMLLLVTNALPNSAPAYQPMLRADAPNPPVEVLQVLKAGGTVDGPEWQAWCKAHRPQAVRSRVNSALDGGGEDCASATVIPILPFTDTGTTTGAADDYNCYCPWLQGGAPDVVYQYTPASNQSITVDLCGSSYDTKVFVYAGSCTGEPVACNDDACGSVWGYPLASRINCLPLTAGMTYYIVVDGFFEYEYGNYVLHVDACNPCGEFPANDLCQNAKVVTSFPYSDTDNNICARHDCANTPSVFSDVWYKFTLTQPGDVTINFCGTTPSFYFAALELTGCGESCLPLLACNEEEYVTCPDFNPTLRWLNVPAGSYYYPVRWLVGSGQTYTINITGPEMAVADFSGFITLSDTRPTNRRFLLTHESGEITEIAFTGFCPGTIGQTVSHADSDWTVLPNGDGNDGDSIIFVASEPLTAGSIGMFVLRYPGCMSDVQWVVGSSSGTITGLSRKPVATLKVSQNAPNPFNPSTTIRFDLAEAAHVRLVVYNLMGQEVAVLLDRMTEAGTYALPFDAGQLTSGVYVYQIEIPGFQQRMKMLLVK